jgi:hypothetical protein
MHKYKRTGLVLAGLVAAAKVSTASAQSAVGVTATILPAPALTQAPEDSLPPRGPVITGPDGRGAFHVDVSMPTCRGQSTLDVPASDGLLADSVVRVIKDGRKSYRFRLRTRQTAHTPPGKPQTDLVLTVRCESRE